MNTENEAFMKDIESVYFEIVKKQSIIATRQEQLDKIFEMEGVDRL